MEHNKYFNELKEIFGFQLYIQDVWNARGLNEDYVCYISESAEGYRLYILKEAGKDIQIMTDVFTSEVNFVSAIKELLLDGDNVLIDDNMATWLDMETDEFWEGWYNELVKTNQIKSIYNETNSI